MSAMVRPGDIAGGLTWLRRTIASLGGADMDLSYPGAVVSAAQPVLVDGDMEAAGVTAWAGSTGTILTNEGSPYRGTQCLRVAGSGNIYALQNTLVVGCRYSGISVWVRYGGTGLAPRLLAAGATPVQATTGAAEWQLLTLADFTATGAYIAIEAHNSGDGYSDFDTAYAGNNLSRTGVTWRGWGALAGLSSSQGTASAMPWETTDTAGRRLLRFDGTGDYLAQNALAAIATNKGQYTLFSAMKLGTFSSATSPYCWGSTGGQYPLRGPLMVSSSQISIRHGIASGNILSSGYVSCAHNTSHILEETCDGSTLGLSVDGGTPATIDVSGLASFTLSNHTIGGWMTGSTFAAAYPVDTYRIIAIPGVPSAAIRSRIRRVLANMYGVTL